MPINPSALPPSRRAFLAAGAAAFAAARGFAARPAPLFGISLAEWSLHRALRAGKMTNLDFPVVAKRDFGIDAVEYVNSFFQDRARDAAYLRDLKRRCDSEGVTSVLIMCDGEGRLGDPDEKERLRCVDNHKRWVEAAATLGCHAIRVNAASAGAYEAQRDLAADGLARLTDFAAPHGVSVIVENHGGLSSNGAWLVEVMKKTARARCGTLPDFGNFKLEDGTTYDRYRGVAEMMPFAKAVSAKSYAFDARGFETTIDYPRMLKIVVDAGYRGRVGVEYEGDAHSEADGIKLTKRLLERVRDELTAAASRPESR